MKIKDNIKKPQLLFNDEYLKESDEYFRRYIVVASWFISILLVIGIVCLHVIEIGG